MTLLLRPVISEEELVARLQVKDRAAFSMLYNNYSAALYGVILRIVKCEQTAEDTMQETFVKVWASFPSYNSTKGRLYTWLLNIARHAAIDAVRAPHYRKRISTQEISEDGSCLRHTAHISFNPVCIGIEKLMVALKPEQKLVIDLLYFGGYSQSEVAEELNLPLGTVKTRARGAMQTLRKLFEPQF